MKLGKKEKEEKVAKLLGEEGFLHTEIRKRHIANTSEFIKLNMGNKLDEHFLIDVIEKLGFKDKVTKALFGIRPELKKDDDELSFRLDLISDDVYQIKLFIEDTLCSEVYDMPTRTADNLRTHFNNIEIASDLSSNECLGWVRYESFDVELLLTDYYRFLDFTRPEFEYDDRLGVCSLVSNDSDISFRLTPFWEDADGIPVEELYDGTIKYQYVIEYDKPTDKDSLEKFKKFYRGLVDDRISLMLKK